VRTHVNEAIAAHLERHGRVGVNVLLHPSDPEPAYNHHQDARFIARDTGPAVMGAPFKGSFCAGLVAAVTAAVHARHPDRAHEPAVVVPLAMSLDMAAVSTQQSGAMLFLQPHNYVGPFARSTNALIPVAVVGALDLGAVGSAASLRAIKRDFMQQVWHEAVGRAIMDNHAAGGTPVGPIGGGGPAIVRRMLRNVSLVIARSQEDADRFASFTPPGGCDVIVTGSMKFDGVKGDRQASDVLRLRHLAGFHDDDVVFLAGSTQAPEEQFALDAFRAVAAAHPRLRLVIVPRHVPVATALTPAVVSLQTFGVDVVA
jgi:hypothetical protein